MYGFNFIPIVVAGLEDIPKGAMSSSNICHALLEILVTGQKSKPIGILNVNVYCIRCQDITEFETNYGILKCQQGPQNLMLPEKAIKMESLSKKLFCERLFM